MSRPLKFLLSFVLFVAVCYVGLVWFVNSEVEKGFNEAVAAVDGLTVNYSDLSVDISDQCVTLADVDAYLPDGQHVTAEEVRITAFDQINPIPHFMAATASGVTIEATRANVGDWAPTFRSLDMGVLKGDVALDYQYTPDADRLDVKALKINVPGVGDADITGSIDRLDLEVLRVEKTLGLRILDLDMTFTNLSLIDAVVRESALGLNISRTEALQRFNQELDAMAEYAGKEKNSVAENALRGLKRYINDPGTVTIIADPKEPVPVLYFFMGRDIYDNIRLMNVKIMTDSSEDI